ncbi:outer membrane lipoprotein-sorting protein [Candidatus Fermentibacteria bacterium]|nr:outer membrane lipoprotein-sorting protein [Candidatus Fermentibacteria bacterium]
MRWLLSPILVSVGLALASGPSLEQTISFLDSLYRSESSYSEMKMHITTPNWERTLEMKVWTEGMDKTFIRIVSPPREAGMATLRIGNEMWNYLPNTNSIMRIPPSMMMGSWMGSDFTNDDLVRETTFFDDYDYAWTRIGDSREGMLYIELTPHSDAPVVWGKVICCVREKDLLPVWMRYYDEDGDLMRVMNYGEYAEMGGRTIPTVMELVPQDEEGSTTLTFLEADFDIGVDPNIFSMRNLRSQN